MSAWSCLILGIAIVLGWRLLNIAAEDGPYYVERAIKRPKTGWFCVAGYGFGIGFTLIICALFINTLFRL